MKINEEAIRLLLPNPESCRERAERMRETYPDMSKRQLAERAISTSKKWAAAAGGAAGVVANPFAMAGLAAADILYMLKAEAQLVGTIGAIYESDVTADPESFAADVLAILFPSAVSQALAQLGINAGKATARTFIRKYVSKDVLKAVIRFAAKYLGLKLTQKAIITKAVPLVGGAIGGVWNWTEVKVVGKRAISYFEDEEEG